MEEFAESPQHIKKRNDAPTISARVAPVVAEREDRGIADIQSFNVPFGLLERPAVTDRSKFSLHCRDRIAECAVSRVDIAIAMTILGAWLASRAWRSVPKL